MARLKFVQMTDEKFEDFRIDHTLDKNVVYQISSKHSDTAYAVSPDGVGAYWYSLDELLLLERA